MKARCDCGGTLEGAPYWCDYTSSLERHRMRWECETCHVVVYAYAAAEAQDEARYERGR